MLRYVARRLLQMVPVFFGATLLIYDPDEARRLWARAEAISTF